MRKILATVFCSALATFGASVLVQHHRIFSEVAAQQATHNLSQPALLAGGQPMAFSSLVEPLFAKDSPTALEVDSLVANPPPIAITVPNLCHLLRLYRDAGIPVPGIASTEHAVQLLTNDSLAAKAFGNGIFFATRYGIRYRLVSDGSPPTLRGENHRDVCLATFADIGLPLSTPMRDVGIEGTIDDLLVDSMQNFDLKQREIEWTIIAYCTYLPGQRAWRNKDGEDFTFDDLAKELLTRPISSGSCGGTHLFYDMILLSRLDQVSACLSSIVRCELDDRVRACVSSAMQTQSPEGFWTLGWDEPSGTHPIIYNSPFFRILVTGHLLEAMEFLPPNLQPKRAVYARAAEWLAAELPKMPVSMSQGMGFCPWTHAVCALRHLVVPDTKSENGRQVGFSDRVVTVLGRS